jgi:acetoin utilization deacetylase AcuC-like enzyme
VVVLIVSGTTGEFDHDCAGHPERPARIEAVMAGVDDLRLGTDLEFVLASAADRASLERVHTPSYLDELAAFCSEGGGDLDPDTYATADSWSAAVRAAGAGLAAIDTLRQRDEGVAFVAARPPGHHAVADRAMGFCLINNVAVAAAALAAEGERVLIVDWDVHHGNGTQAIFWDDPNVLYVSTHQWPLFPGTGRPLQIGGPHALGGTVNVPLPRGATGDVVRQAIDEVALPAIDEFEPTWVLVSAGFDAHRADPMAELALSSGDFGDLARVVAAFAPRPGRLALFLEGGYDLGALRMSVATTLGALLGGPYQPEEPTFGGPGTEMVQLARAERVAAVRRAQETAPSEESSP